MSPPITRVPQPLLIVCKHLLSLPRRLTHCCQLPGHWEEVQFSSGSREEPDTPGALGVHCCVLRWTHGGLRPSAASSLAQERKHVLSLGACGPRSLLALLLQSPSLFIIQGHAIYCVSQLSCHNQTPHTGGLKQQKCISYSSRGWKSQTKEPTYSVPGEVLFLAWQLPPSSCALMWLLISAPPL